jgi:hypothetical protein
MNLFIETYFFMSRECEVFLRRSKKWKSRTKTLETHVEKLRQILQTVGKLLQMHGYVPNS